MRLSREMVELKNKLEKIGHSVRLPDFTEEYSKMQTTDEGHSESVKNKLEHDLIRGHFKEIKNSDAVLVVNETLKGIKNYVGGNTFLEMGFAHILNKKIFILNNIPQMGYSDEIVAMQPIVLDGDLGKIK